MNDQDAYYGVDEALPPAALEAEQAIIGAMLRDSKIIGRAASKMSSRDFYHHGHGDVFSAIVELYKAKKGVDVITVNEYMINNGINSIDLAYLGNTIRNTPVVSNIDSFVNIVRERAVLRGTLTALSQISDSVYNPKGKSASEIIQGGVQKLQEISKTALSGTEGTKRMATLLREANSRTHTRMQTGKSGAYETGIAGYDDRLTGVANTEFMVIGGRPAQGKTSLGITMLQNIAAQYKVPCVVFSMEMPDWQIVDRMICSTGSIDAQRYKTGKLLTEDLEKMQQATARIEQSNIIINDGARLTPNRVRAALQHYTEEFGQLGPVVLDYLQLIKSDFKENDPNRVMEEVTRELKLMAIEFNCPIIALSQMNRDFEKRIKADPSSKPVMADLRNGGSIEQDANTVVFCLRPETYFGDGKDENLKGYAELVTAKARDGEVGVSPVEFVGKHTRYQSGDSVRLIEQQEHFTKQYVENNAPRFQPRNY